MKRSDMATKPNAVDDQMTISSAKRDRCTAATLAAASGFQDEVAVGHRVEGVRRWPGEAELGGGHVAVDWKGCAGKRGGAERRLVQPRPRVGEAAAVALEHLDVGEQVMAEGHRLGDLQMGEAGHDGGGGGERPLGERLLKTGERRVDVVDGVAHPQAQVGGDLVVAGAGGVQPSGGRPDQLGRAAPRR